MVDISETRYVGKTSVQVNVMGLGTGSLGFLYEPVSTEEAAQIIQSAYDAGIRFFDTAALYGKGLAEQRLGRSLSRLPRHSYTLATKVGYEIPEEPPATPEKNEKVRNFSYDGVMRSFENSLKRLGLDSVDIVHIHDPDDHEREAIEGAYKAIWELRSQGMIKAIGVGMNQSAMLARFASNYEFDCFLLAGRYTLLDQEALTDLMPIAEEKGISIFVGGALNSGILADPYSETPLFNYRPAEKKWIEKARRLDEVCLRYEVPLKAAALQFPLAHPAVDSVLTGARSQKELMENVYMLEYEIPSDLWRDCKQEGLISEEAPIPGN